MRNLIVILGATLIAISQAAAQQRYAVIDGSGNVANVIVADSSYSPAPGYSMVQSDTAGPGWKWSQSGGFVAPTAAIPNLASSMQLVSTSTPALNGLYATDTVSQQKVQAISLYIAVNGRFPAGQATESWPDANGVMHQFQTTGQWQAFATAMGDFVAATDLGQTPTQPVIIP
jgi:hypothetical protein